MVEVTSHFLDHYCQQPYAGMAELTSHFLHHCQKPWIGIADVIFPWLYCQQPWTGAAELTSKIPLTIVNNLGQVLQNWHQIYIFWKWSDVTHFWSTHWAPPPPHPPSPSFSLINESIGLNKSGRTDITVPRSTSRTSDLGPRTLDREYRTDVTIPFSM